MIDGARSTLNVSVTGNEFVRSGHAIPLDEESTTGWGRLELPTDANLADNVYRFVYADAAGQNTLVVSENTNAGEYLRLAAATAMAPGQVAQADLITPDYVATVDWDEPALVLWQAPLPEGIIARQLQEFVASGRCVLFFPPERTSSATLFGCRWKQWKGSDTAFGIARWRTETDLFANSRSGFPLPLGELSFYRYCELESERSSVLASLDGGAELLVHSWSDSGAAWFFTSLPEQRSSTLVDNGIAFYVMVQRALARGTTALGNARQIDCGTVTSSDVADWLPLDEPSRAVFPSTRSTRAGLYANGGFRMALNRPLSEDSVATIDDDVVKSLFDGLQFTRLDDSVVSSASLASEIWRLFLICMIVALIAESLLSLPRREKDTSQLDLAVGFFETRREASATVETTSMTFYWYWTTTSLIVSVVTLLVAAGCCWLSWQRSEYQKTMGLLELFRLLVIVCVVFALNQPEAGTAMLPDEQPVVVLLHDQSGSMETIDVVTSNATSPGPVRRSQAALPLIKSELWEPLRKQFKIVVEPFSSELPDAAAATDIGFSDRIPGRTASGVACNCVAVGWRLEYGGNTIIICH